MKQILVSGSTAYDTYLHHDGKLEDYFSQGDIKKGLNMSLITEDFEKCHGGTGSNIAFNLALLGENAILLTSFGGDFAFDGIIQERINLKYVHREKKAHTANSIIVSDKEDNRMTFFHPGAMKYASLSEIKYIEESIGCAIISANHVPTMLEHARYFQEKNIKIFLDPAQQISQMNREEIREFISLGNVLLVNQYEYGDIQAIGSFTEEELTQELEILIVTYGEQGSYIYTDATVQHIPAIDIPEIEDSTGAGDAYRAGVLKGFIEGMNWELSCQLGTILASYCLHTSGAQNHHFSLGNINEDFKQYFDKEVDMYVKRKY